MKLNLKLGQIYWLKLKDQHIHPYVITNINDEIIVVTKITTNQKKASLPGNILLEIGEGNLDRKSIIDVATTIEIKQSELGKYIGELDENRMKEIQKGIEFIKRSFFRT